MRKPLKSLVPLKDLLSEAVKFQSTPADSWIGVLRDRWSEIAGPTLGRQSRPVRIWKKNLIVGVESSAWAQEIDLLRQSLLEKIRTVVPAANLKGIRPQIAA